MITGIVGGILRDILCNDVPLVFTGQLYAIVSIIAGGVYYGATVLGMSYDVALISGIAVGMTLRVVAIVYNVEIPKFSYERDPR